MHLKLALPLILLTAFAHADWKSYWRDLQYKNSWLPRGTLKNNNVPLDIIDRVLADVTLESSSEVATIEFLDQNGKTLAIVPYSDGSDRRVTGDSSIPAVDKIISIMKEKGWAGSVHKVRMRHTHPADGIGDETVFSKADKEAALYFKAFCDLHFKKPIELETQIIFTSHGKNTRKKSLFFPSSTSLIYGDYKTDSKLDPYIGVGKKGIWSGTKKPSPIVLEEVALDIYDQLSKDVWKEGFSTSTRLGLIRRQLVLGKMKLAPLLLQKIKEAKDKYAYLGALHAYINNCSQPTTLRDALEISQLVETTRKKHFPDSQNNNAIFRELINFEKIASKYLNKTDYFLFESDKKEVRKAIVDTLKYLPQTEEGMALQKELNPCGWYFSLFK